MNVECAVNFRRRSVDKHPPLDLRVERIERWIWGMFRSYHYMSAGLHRGVKCFGALSEGDCVGFCAVLHFPHPKNSHYRIHRLVVLPDWQGLGIGLLLLDTVGALYSALGRELRMPAMHPSLIRSLDRSPRWSMTKRPGVFTTRNRPAKGRGVGFMGGRPTAVFCYVGSSETLELARRMVA